MNKFVDIHTHLLFNVDDGAQSIEESMSLMHLAFSNNIHTIFLTPHKIPGSLAFSNSKINTHFEQLKNSLKNEGIDINLQLGSEIMLNQNIFDDIDSNNIQTLGKSQYVLVELETAALEFENSQRYLDELINHHYVPIIAHPERYFENSKTALVMVNQWIKNGCYIQINRSSIMNSKNRISRNICKTLLNKKKVHFVASDSHDLSGNRIPVLDDAYQFITRRYGKAYANYMFFENTNSVLNNLKIEQYITKKYSYRLNLWRGKYE